jgi:hypothetical protein
VHGSYVSSLLLINGLDTTKLTVENTSFDSASFAQVLKLQKEYSVNNMKYLGEYFANLYNIEYEAK